MGKYETKRNKVIKVAFTIVLTLILLLLITTTCLLNFEIVIDIAELPSIIEYGEECVTPNAYLRGRYIFKDNIKTVDVTKICESSDIGTHANCYYAEYWLYSKELKHNVTVVDTKAPIIELKHDDNKLTTVGSAYVEEGFVAYDNYDGDITEDVSVFVNGDSVTYFVQDSSGNSYIVERKVRYKDQTPPVIELIGDTEVTVRVGEKYVDPGAVANDNLDGDITDEIQISDTLNTDVAGSYTLIYSVQDSHGNKSVINRYVEVIDHTTTPEKGKTIYLTFDDGPSRYTMRLLDILDKYNVKATFFVVGNGDYTDVIKTIVDRGHAIGIHSINHEYGHIYSSVESFMDDLYGMQKIISDLTDVETYLMRFPGGSSNTVSKRYSVGIMTRLVREVKQGGFSYFDWNVDSEDAGGKIKTPEEVFENVTNGVQEYQHSIVLQHDTKDFSVEAVELIIKWGLENGYTFSALDGTSPTAHHKIKN